MGNVVEIARYAPDSPLLPLRDYQREALAAIAGAEREGVRRQLVSLPTGCGKTVIFAHLVRDTLAERGGRALVLAHRDELIEQTVEKLEGVGLSPGDIGVVKAERDDVGARVVVASVQTLARQARLERLAGAAEDIPLVITDEAHHAVAPTYLRVYEALHAGASSAPPWPLHVGFTATPLRGDKRGLSPVFERIVFHRNIEQMIAAGWLVEPGGRMVKCDFDLRAVRIRAGDYAAGDLERVMLVNHVTRAIAAAWLEHAADRPTLVFTVSVRHAHQVAGAINALAGKPLAAALDGTTPLEERRELVRRLRAGELRCLVNCAVLTEGFDAPNVSCILVARPTRSEALYVQMIGRGLRLWPGKRDCLVLDVTGVSEEHSLVTLPTLFGLEEGDLGGRTVSEVREEQEARRQRMRLAQEERRVNLMRRKIAWVEVRADPPVFALSLPPESAYDDGEWTKRADRYIVAGRRSDGVWVAAYLVYAGQRFNVLRERRMLYESPPGVEDATGMSYALGAAETFLGNDPAAGRFVSNAEGWRARNDPATPAQVQLLRRLGAAPKPNLTKAEAADIITSVKLRRLLDLG